MIKFKVIFFIFLVILFCVLAWFARQADIKKHLRPANTIPHTQY